MTRIQLCLTKLNVNLGYYNEKEIWPRNKALFLQNNHFCLIEISEGISLKQVIRELKEIFKVVDKYKTVENVNSHFENKFTPDKNESHLTNFITYDSETDNADRARLYEFCFFFRLSKLAAKYYRALTPYEIEKCKKDTIVFDGDNCVSNALDFRLKLKVEERSD